MALINAGIHSEIESDEAVPKAKSFKWRTALLTDTLHKLDDAWVSMAGTKTNEKDKRRKRLLTLKPKVGGPVEGGWGHIPNDIPQNWIVDEAKEELNEIELAAYSWTPDVDLAPMLARLETITQPKKKAGTSGRATA